MASTGTTPAELLIDINSTIRTQTGANTITPTTHSDLLDNIVKVLSGGTEYTDTFFVMKNGDDSTGTINDISKPYSTILSAKTAAEIAMSGDPSIRSLIYVFNGSYSGESSLMYNGAYYFEANTYVETASLTENLSKALFYAGGPDRDETPTYNKTCKVFGHAHFHAVPCSDEGTTSNPWNNGIITINDSGSTLEMNCDKLTATAGGRQVAVGGGTLKLVCDSMEFGSTYSAATGNYANFDGVALYSGTLDIDCNTLVTNYPYSSSIHSVGIYQGTNYGLLSRININHIKSTARLNDFSSSYHSSSIFFYQTGLGGYDANVTLDVNTINSNGWSVHSLDVRSGNLSVNVNRAESEQGVFLWNRVNEVSLDTSMSIKGHYVTISGDTSQTAAYIYNRNSNSNYYLDGVFENKGTSKAVEINDTNAERILMNGAFYSQTGTTVNISAIGNPLVMENVYLYNELGTYNIESTSAEIVNSLGTLYLDSQVDSNTTINGLYSTLNTVYTPALNINSIGSGTSITNLGVDSSGNVISGTTAGAALWADGSSGTNPVKQINNTNVDALNDYATAMGNSNKASGETSVSMGYYTYSKGVGSFVGGYNDQINFPSDGFYGITGETFDGKYYHVGTGSQARGSFVYGGGDGEGPLYVGGSYSQAFGYNNVNLGGYSAIFGRGNVIYNSNSLHNLVSGTGNALTGGSRNLVAGNGNKITTTSSSDNLMVGDRNVDSGGVSDSLIGGNQNTVGGGGLIVGGGSNTVLGQYNIVGGSGNDIQGSYHLVFGGTNTFGGDTFGSFVGGFDNVINGEDTAFAFGNENTINGNEASMAIGFTNIVNGSTSFAYGKNHVLNGNGSVILGGNGLTGASDNTVYVPKMNIGTCPAYDDDAAAGVGGLTTGDMYQTTGSGAAPLNVAGILMIKQ